MTDRDLTPALRRAIQQRKHQERQARCPHERTTTIRTMGEPDRVLCEDCGLTLDPKRP
jgi:hypothetical protein